MLLPNNLRPFGIPASALSTIGLSHDCEVKREAVLALRLPWTHGDVNSIASNQGAQILVEGNSCGRAANQVRSRLSVVDQDPHVNRAWLSDRSIFRTTVDFYRSAGLDSATVSVLIPFPNTPLFKRLEAEGRILTRDWSNYNGKKDVVSQPALMSPRELLLGMEWAARQFYSLGSIVERMARSRTGLWWNIPRNLGYHLALRNFGKLGFNPE